MPNCQILPCNSHLVLTSVILVFGHVMYIHSSQSKVILLPVQHVVCYLNEVIPAQLQGTGRERRGIRCKNKIVIKKSVKLVAKLQLQ